MSAFMVNTDTLALLASACRFSTIEHGGHYVYAHAMPVTLELSESVEIQAGGVFPGGVNTLNIRSTDMNLSGLIFNELWAVNAMALNDRYESAGDMIGDTGTEYSPIAMLDLEHRHDPIAWARVLLGAIACYEYQACEWQGWRGSWAESYLSGLRRAVTRYLSNGYWEYEREAPPLYGQG